MDRQLEMALALEDRLELPREHRGGGTWTWVRAIARVSKQDGTSSWAVLRFDGRETYAVKDFGTSSPIARVESLHPTLWVKPGDMPSCDDPVALERSLPVIGYSPQRVRELYRAGDRDELRVAAYRYAAYIAEERAREKRKVFASLKALRKSRPKKPW